MIKVLELDSLLRRLEFAYNRNVFWTNLGGPSVRTLTYLKPQTYTATKTTRCQSSDISEFPTTLAPICRAIIWPISLHCVNIFAGNSSPTNNASLSHEWHSFNLPFFWSFLLILSHCNRTKIDVTAGLIFRSSICQWTTSHFSNKSSLTFVLTSTFSVQRSLRYPAT